MAPAWVELSQVGSFEKKRVQQLCFSTMIRWFKYHFPSHDSCGAHLCSSSNRLIPTIHMNCMHWPLGFTPRNFFSSSMSYTHGVTHYNLLLTISAYQNIIIRLFYHNQVELLNKIAKKMIMLMMLRFSKVFKYLPFLLFFPPLFWNMQVGRRLKITSEYHK